jgi:hypothetical protein
MHKISWQYIQQSQVTSQVWMNESTVFEKCNLMDKTIRKTKVNSSFPCDLLLQLKCAKSAWNNTQAVTWNCSLKTGTTHSLKKRQNFTRLHSITSKTTVLSLNSDINIIIVQCMHLWNTYILLNITCTLCNRHMILYLIPTNGTYGKYTVSFHSIVTEGNSTY